MRSIRWSWRTILAVVLAMLVGCAVYPVAGVLAASRLAVRSYQVPSVAMAPTIDSGDRVLVDRLRYHVTDPERGDIIVFTGPDTWGMAQEDPGDFLKRVIAVEGDTVQCCSPDSRVLVNGEPVDEPYLAESDLPQEAFGPVQVPDGRLWVMGDNRNNSADSRRHMMDEHSGTIAVDDVVGRVSVVAWPLSRLGTVD